MARSVQGAGTLGVFCSPIREADEYSCLRLPPGKRSPQGGFSQEGGIGTERLIDIPSSEARMIAECEASARRSSVAGHPSMASSSAAVALGPP